MTLQVGDLVKVKDISSFQQTEGGEELLDEVFSISEIIDGRIYLEDCHEFVLDEIFYEDQLIKEN